MYRVALRRPSTYTGFSDHIVAADVDPERLTIGFLGALSDLDDSDVVAGIVENKLRKNSCENPTFKINH
jgi:hypothetical protein